MAPILPPGRVAAPAPANGTSSESETEDSSAFAGGVAGQGGAPELDDKAGDDAKACSSSKKNNKSKKKSSKARRGSPASPGAAAAPPPTNEERWPLLARELVALVGGDGDRNASRHPILAGELRALEWLPPHAARKTMDRLGEATARRLEDKLRKAMRAEIKAERRRQRVRFVLFDKMAETVAMEVP